MKTDLTDSSETRSGLHTPSIGRRPTLAVRIGLFVVFTLALVAATYLLLPTLVVIGPWGYVAGFVINLLTNATVMLPAPGFAAVIVMAKELDPFLLGLTAGLGGALGELSGFWLGSQGRDLVRANLIYRIARVYMGPIRRGGHLRGGTDSGSARGHSGPDRRIDRLPDQEIPGLRFPRQGDNDDHHSLLGVQGV